MADDTAEIEGCWLANTTSGERPINFSGFDLSKRGKSFEQEVLPCHEELFTEHLELKEKIKQALMMLNKKDQQLEDTQGGIEKEMEEYNKEKLAFEKEIKQQEERLSEINDQICRERASLATLEESGEKDRLETAKIEKQVVDAEKCMEMQNGSIARQLQSKSSLLFRHIDCLSGIIVNYAEENKISVSILGRQETDNQRNEIEVILWFREKDAKNCLSYVEVKSDVCSWDDLIDAAINTAECDAVWLLQEIKRRYHTAYGLQDEIEMLQKRYAIDWLADQRLIAIIIPGKRQTTCRLKLHDNYSSNQSVECIYADEPLKEKVANIELKIKNKETSGLTQWLEQLHETDSV